MKENIAAVLYGAMDLKIEIWPLPDLSDNEVLIEMSCVGICGSDVKLYSTGRCGVDRITEPMVMGHEGAGVVVKVGSKVKNLSVGARVAIEPTQPCRACQFCKRGQYNVCVTPHYCSSMGAPGNLCTYYKHVADFCHEIPANLSMEEAAAVQPLAIALHACNRARVTLGSRVAILGAGPVGVLCAMTARAMGAATILITDVVESRLQTAKELGPFETLLTHSEDSDEHIERQITTLLGDRPDVTIDACGFAQAQRVAMNVTQTGGTVLVVGIGEESVRVPLSPALLREVDVRGSFRINNTYPAALQAVSNGAIPLQKFITHHYPIEKSKEALALAKTGAAMKIIIHLDKK